MRGAGLRPRRKLQHALDDAQVRIAWNDVDVIRLDRLVVLDFAHRKRRGASENLHERALVLWIEMLHEHEPQAGVEWQRPEKLRERLEPPGRGADADDRKERACAQLIGFARGTVRRRFRVWSTRAHGRSASQSVG